MIDILADRMAKSASGYAAVINGVLDIRTTSDTRNGVALNAFAVLGAMVVSTCRNPDCDCLAKDAERFGIKIVRVTMEATDG